MATLNNSTGNLHSNVHVARTNLLSYQSTLPPSTTSDGLRKGRLSFLYSSALLEEGKFRANWVKQVDVNNSYHQLLA